MKAALNIYQKTRHVMEKVSQIREQKGLGKLAQPLSPTPSDVLQQLQLATHLLQSFIE